MTLAVKVLSLLVLACRVTHILPDNGPGAINAEPIGGGLPWYAKPGNPAPSESFGYGGLKDILTSDSALTILKNCTDFPVSPNDLEGQLACSKLPNVANKGCLSTTVPPYYECVCEDGYECRLCKIRKNPCYPGVRQHYCNETNSDRCTASEAGQCHPPTCECRPGWTTKPSSRIQCSDDIDECSQVPSICPNRMCVNTPGSYTCVCRSGYGGPDCKYSDKCGSNMVVPCADDASCLEEAYKGRYYAKCICQPPCIGNPYVSCCESSHHQVMKVYGSLSFESFDNYDTGFGAINYVGTCPVTLARPSAQINHVPRFKVVSRSTTECANDNKFSCLRYIYIDIENHRIRLDGKDPTKILLNDSYLEALPYTELAPLLTVTDSWEVKTSFAMESTFYSPQPYHGTSDSYILTFYDGSGTFANKMCGMGGNMNGDPSDDMMKPDGTITADPIELGDSWAADNIGDYDSWGCLLGKDILTDDPQRRENQTWAAFVTSCHYLNDGQGIFKQCFENMDKARILHYYSICYYDIAYHRTSVMAELEKVNDRVCMTYLTKFVDECRSAIMHNHRSKQCVLSEWRQVAGCPNPGGANVCPEYAHWDDCASMCLNTCENPDAAYICPTKQVQARCDCNVNPHDKYVFNPQTQTCVHYPDGCPGGAEY